jgi:hypothetical protein
MALVVPKESLHIAFVRIRKRIPSEILGLNLFE